MQNVYRTIIKPVLFFIMLFFIWESSVRLFSIPDWLLPGPVQIYREAVAGFSVYAGHILPTISLAVSGLVIGALCGTGTAMLLHRIPVLKEIFYPLLIISQNIPIIVLAPLLVIWFGFGVLPKIIVITLVCFFPITISLLSGFLQTDRELKHYMLMAGASKKQIFWKLEWPASLPALFSGLKISATYSILGAVISEWLGAKKGIGVFMTLSSSAFRTDRVFIAIFIIVIFSLLLFFLIQLLERLFIRWKPSGEGDDYE